MGATEKTLVIVSYCFFIFSNDLPMSLFGIQTERTSMVALIARLLLLAGCHLGTVIIRDGLIVQRKAKGPVRESGPGLGFSFEEKPFGRLTRS